MTLKFPCSQVIVQLELLTVGFEPINTSSEQHRFSLVINKADSSSETRWENEQTGR